MKVCVAGSGGREHALAVALGRTADVVVTPGNAGMAALGVDCAGDPAETVEADLYVIGPEAPLVDGLADRLRAAGRLVFGPGADGARLEGSKAWMKEVLAEAGVPTAAYGAFSEPGPAIELIRNLPGPWVVKTDGLAAGKGVLVTGDRSEAEADVMAKLSGDAFGDAGRTVVVEEGLTGPELSLMAVCDGRRAWALAPAQDFKRVGDGDAGPNTGGMGSCSPVPGVDADVVENVMKRAVEPTLAALVERGIDFRGVLYAGIMLTPDGPKVLEFNVRFGDPETQVVLPRWQGDVAAVLAAAAAGRLDRVDPPVFSDDAAVCVVLASAGYPESPRAGDRIEGLRAFAPDPGAGAPAGAPPGRAAGGLAGAVPPPGVTVYSAGVAAFAGPGSGGPAGPLLVTSGGRVVGVTATGADLDQARRRAYEAVIRISWPGMQFRNDIAADAAARAK